MSDKGILVVGRIPQALSGEFLDTAKIVTVLALANDGPGDCMSCYDEAKPPHSPFTLCRRECRDDGFVAACRS